MSNRRRNNLIEIEQFVKKHGFNSSFCNKENHTFHCQGLIGKSN